MPPLRRPKGRFAIAANALTAIFAACHGSGGSTASLTFTGATMLPGPLAYLDSTLYVVFADELDPDTVNEQSVQLLAISGPGAGIPVRGTWRVGSLGAGTRRNTIEFEPDLPNAEPVVTSGGLQPDTRYELRIAGGNVANAVHTQDGRRLEDSLLYPFVTRSGLVSQCYEHNLEGGPRLVDAVPSPRDGEGRWRLGRSNEGAVLRVLFDQPLDPSESNLPRSPTTTARGPIALLYDDPEYGPDTWIPCDIELERNAVLGTTVAMHPRGVLPSAANLRITISGGLRDLFGEDRNTPGSAVAGTLATETAYEPQFDAVAFDFAKSTTLGDTNFPEVPAVITDGALRVPDTFPALEGVGDWSPSGSETLLRTDVQTLQYEHGLARTFEGGVLHMKNLHIHAGQVVRGVGPNPLVLVVDGDAVIDGLLTVSGADGNNAFFGTYRGPGDVSPPAPGSLFSGGGENTAQGTPGPAGGPGGGNGGRLPPDGTLPTATNGNGPTAAPDAGGSGGPYGCDPCTRSAGGGGGAMSTAGDPWFPSLAAGGTAFVQRLGQGGYGCAGISGASTRTLPGGPAGNTVLRNGDANDDYWGEAFVPWLGQRRTGELVHPIGGAGGGAGGNFAWDGSCESDYFFRGGDGGGGGGVLVLQVRGTLTVGANGHVEANGGNGSRGIGWYEGIGGGAGGAGGMLVLMAGRALVLHMHGETFANRDYDFVLSADGGIGRSRGFYNPTVPGKYPLNGSPTMPGHVFDDGPVGGFGGLGVIQLMVPPGTDNADGTNTVLDDAITIVRNGITLQGAEKQRFLGWRGFQNESGVYLDDFGMPTNTIGGQGDMRPDPVLMPAPFTSHGRARARSAWLPLGGLARRSLSTPDGEPRAVLGEPLVFGNHARDDGWLPFGDGQLTATATEGLLAQPAAIESMAIDTTTFDHPVYAVRLTAALPQHEPDAYASTVANLTMITGSSVARLRVLGNTSNTLFLEPESVLPINATRVQLHAFHAELATPAPDTYAGILQTLPRANARIGFAFHRDPANAQTSGADPNRFPTQTGTFLFDLAEPGTRNALQAFGATAMQWDALLDGEYRTLPGDTPPPAEPNSAIALRRFWLPVRF